MESNKVTLNRQLGMREGITITTGIVVGVGLFTTVSREDIVAIQQAEAAMLDEDIPTAAEKQKWTKNIRYGKLRLRH